MPAYHPKGAHVANSSLSNAVTLTNNDDEVVSGILVQALVQNIRYTLSNTTPSSTVGFQLKAGDPPVRVDLDEGMSIRFIEESASATLQYQWLA